MVEYLVRKSLQFKISFLATILALSIISAIYFFGKFGSSDNSLPVWFEKDDPYYKVYQDFLEQFGNDRFVILAFEVPEVFTSEVLNFVKSLSKKLAELNSMERVISLSEVESIDGQGDAISIAPLLQSIPDNDKELYQLKVKVLSEPDYKGHLVSEDSQVVVLIAKINTDNSVEASARLHQQIMDVVLPLNTKKYPFHISGSPITDEAFDHLVVRDQKIFLPGIILMVMTLIVLFFRNVFLTIIPTLLQVVVLFVILSLYFMMGYKMNVTAGMMVPILIAVTIADSVHVMLEYYHERALGLRRDKALVASAVKLWRPCLFTAGTTLVGFISFQSSSIPPINVLGTMTALGVAVAFILTIFFIPVVLSLLPEPKKEVVLHVHESFIQRFLKFTLHLNERYPKQVAQVFLLLFLLSVWGMKKLTIETNFMEYFPKSHVVRKDIEFFNNRLSGVVAYDMVLSSSSGDLEMAHDPKVLKAIDQLKEEALKDPHTLEVLGPVNTVKKLNQAFHEGKLQAYRIPDTREEVAQLLLLAESSGSTELDQFITKDLQHIHLSFKTNLVASEVLDEYLKKMQTRAEAVLNLVGIHVQLTGFGPLWVRLDKNILLSQITSFGIAFIVISLMMMVMLKSFKAGLISMIPNVLPIFYTMGLMGFLGIHLNVSTVMIAGITIGITVDDTIHYLTRFKEILQKEKDYLSALRFTNQSIGTAIIFTSCILIGGFSVTCLGSFVPSIYFGTMSALTLFLSIFCEVCLMPLLIIGLKPFKV